MDLGSTNDEVKSETVQTKDYFWTVGMSKKILCILIQWDTLQKIDRHDFLDMQKMEGLISSWVQYETKKIF